jgi:uncharacterized phiE125 gp8 family phage protein
MWTHSTNLFPGQFEQTSDNNTLQNYQLYDVISLGPSPVSLEDMKLYLSVTNSVNDVLIQQLINACTSWGELYTARDFRANNYNLYLDLFATRIELRKNPISIINSIDYYVDNNFVTIDSDIYYLKNGFQISEILLIDSEQWPTNGDTIEQAIKIDFTTKAVDERKLQIAEDAIKRHVAYMFENRGDCVECSGCAGSDAANVKVLYDMLRIPRF